MPSGDYSAEFKQRFADGYADGATIAMLQHEFGLAKSTVKLWRERIDQGGVGAMDRPRRNSRYPRDFKLRVVEAYLLGGGPLGGRRKHETAKRRGGNIRPSPRSRSPSGCRALNLNLPQIR